MNVVADQFSITVDEAGLKTLGAEISTFGFYTAPSTFIVDFGKSKEIFQLTNVVKDDEGDIQGWEYKSRYSKMFLAND